MRRPFAVLLLSAAVVSAQTPSAVKPPSAVLEAPAAFSPDGLFAKPPAPTAPVGDAVFANPPAAPPPKIWSGSLEAGLNGATGNTDVFNGRLGWNADRKTDTNFLHTDFLYTLNTQDGRTTQNTALFNARDEILFPGSPWSFFAATNIEYDELRAYEFRIGIYAGVGYTVIDTEQTLFKLRGGAGAVREIGGPKDRWVPELVLGYDLRHKFNDRSSIVSTLDYYPRIDDFTQFRLRARVAYEFIVDPSIGMAFRIGAQSRYDSDPGPGTNKHDLNYFATLAMKF